MLAFDSNAPCPSRVQAQPLSIQFRPCPATRSLASVPLTACGHEPQATFASWFPRRCFALRWAGFGCEMGRAPSSAPCHGPARRGATALDRLRVHTASCNLTATCAKNHHPLLSNQSGLRHGKPSHCSCMACHQALTKSAGEPLRLPALCGTPSYLTRGRRRRHGRAGMPRPRIASTCRDLRL